MNPGGDTAKALGMEKLFPHSFGTRALSTWAEICNPGLVHSMVRVSPSPQTFPQGHALCYTVLGKAVLKKTTSQGSLCQSAQIHGPEEALCCCQDRW